MKPMRKKPWFKRFFNRQAWMSVLLGRPVSQEPAGGRGLVLIQVDGFSLFHLEKALQQGYMPFLKKLLHHRHYRTWPFYPGVPTVTPAVQGELFYGVRQCVPSFQFYDRARSEKFTMYKEKSAVEMERTLAEQGQALLKGGSSYGNIFAGGAGESHICAVNNAWKYLAKGFNPYTLLVSFLLHPYGFLRAIGLALVEIGLAVYDVVRGFLKGYSLNAEVQFILTRFIVTILMRELITSHVRLDIYRGLPVIHLNFFGFDEQAHRRGPTTRFAFWSLRGIDSAIRRIYRAAQNADRRQYDVWIYSDHGQEDVVPYARLAGQSLKSVVAELYRRAVKGEKGDGQRPVSEAPEPSEDLEKELIVTAMGPVGHVYFMNPLKPGTQEKIGADLAKRGMVPLVIGPADPERIVCWTMAGRHELPADAAKVIGPKHKYAKEVMADLKTLCAHSGRGDLILMGWSHGSPSVSFPDENGAHGGIGPMETEGFALLPAGVSVPGKEKDFLRPNDLRNAALSLLDRSSEPDKGLEISETRTI